MSLLLCLMTLGMWVRSYFVLDVFYYATSAGNSITLWSGFGEVSVRFLAGVPGEEGFWHESTRVSKSVLYMHQDHPDRNLIYGFGLVHDSRNFTPPQIVPNYRYATITIPSWFLAAILSIAPVVWFFKWQRVKKLALKGCCVNCGYDLRATPDRCPECGTVFEKRPEAQPVPPPVF